jgi:hypothetical protein
MDAQTASYLDQMRQVSPALADKFVELCVSFDKVNHTFESLKVGPQTITTIERAMLTAQENSSILAQDISGFLAEWHECKRKAAGGK